jgi:thiamine-monophosphate kinase
VKQPILAHLAPTPRLGIGRYLAEHQIAHAMTDISDGLSTDLFHICEAGGTGAVIDADKIPVATDIPQGVGIDALESALHGGEDYELLFTVSRDRMDWINDLKAEFADVPITYIGDIIDEPGEMFLEWEDMGEELLPCGYDHLKNKR